MVFPYSVSNRCCCVVVTLKNVSVALEYAQSPAKFSTIYLPQENISCLQGSNRGPCELWIVISHQACLPLAGFVLEIWSPVHKIYVVQYKTLKKEKRYIVQDGSALPVCTNLVLWTSTTLFWVSLWPRKFVSLPWRVRKRKVLDRGQNGF